MNRKAKILVIALSCSIVFYAVVGGLLGKETSRENAYKQLQVFSEVLLRIRSDYVEEPNMKEVSEGALRGLLESLDPYSSYLTPQEVAEMEGPNQKEKGDIGLQISKRFGYINVVAALSNSPADRAGLVTGDIIEAINGISTRDVSVQQAKMFFRGPVSGTVTLSVLRGRRTEPIKVDILREVLSTTPIESRIIDQNVGYLRVSALAPGRSQEVKKAIENLERQGAKRFVLDIRDMATAQLDEAVGVANLFLDHGTILSVEGQKYPKKNFVADKARAITELPLAVLINRGSASDAEVIASAIMENNRGDVVGERSYGIGSVQKMIPLEDGAAVILSIGKYYTPSGRLIQNDKEVSKAGVTPNVVVSLPDENQIAQEEVPEDRAAGEEEKAQTRSLLPNRGRNAEDLILKKALEVLSEDAAKKKMAA